PFATAQHVSRDLLVDVLGIENARHVIDARNRCAVEGDEDIASGQTCGFCRALGLNATYTDSARLRQPETVPQVLRQHDVLGDDADDAAPDAAVPQDLRQHVF